MNIAQQLFAVFFAIFWGTASNAWPRWKPFHWPFVWEHSQVLCRVLLSILLLNLFPIGYFAIVLAWLGQGGPTDGNLYYLAVLREVLRGVSPAFAVFGFYRMWFGIIESRPSLFYLTDKTLPPELKEIEPTSDTLNIGHRWWCMNVGVGLVYVLLPLVVVWLLRHK